MLGRKVELFRGRQLVSGYCYNIVLESDKTDNLQGKINKQFGCANYQRDETEMFQHSSNIVII